MAGQGPQGFGASRSATQRRFWRLRERRVSRPASCRKFIKAFLVRYQVEFPKSHNVALLRQLVARVDPRLAETLVAADALTPYGVEFRYPGDLPSVSRDEGEKAIRLAAQTRALITESLKSYLDAGRPGNGEPGKK